MRWRPPTRPLILIALLLLVLVGGGAVVNVAVAWGIAGAPDSWTPGGPSSTYLAIMTSRGEELLYEGTAGELKQREEDIERARSALHAPADWPELSLASLTRGRGWVYRTGIYGERGERRVLTRVASGWPMRSMACSTVFYEVERVNNYAHSLPPPQTRFLAPRGNWFPSPRERLPLKPIPAGFAINTLFYAALVGAILALPLSFFPVRRRLRARRGRCPKCGYDLAGLGGAPGGPPLRGGRGADPEGGAPCPECGAAR